MEEIAASPIENDDVSTSELNITQLSLPDSFDESLCLDLYRRGELKSRPTNEIAPAAAEKAADTGINHQGNSNDALADTSYHNNHLEQKMRQLLSANLELKEKGRLYDSLKMRSVDNEALIEELRIQMQHQTAFHDSSIVREKQLQHQILEYKRKINIMSIDLEHAQKETEVFLSRAEKSEADNETSASALRRCENEVARAKAEMEESRSRSEREIVRIREESNTEVTSSRTHQTKAFGRESKLLSDARDQALEQTRLLQRQLSELREEKEAKDTENDGIIKVIEDQLSDLRSDLKMKSCELNTLQTCQDRTSAESCNWKEETNRHVEAMAQLHNKYALLERKTGQLEEAIRQKDEALSMYHHDDLLVDCDTENIEPNSPALFSGRKALVKNSVALARKCRELQTLLKKSGSEVTALSQENDMLSQKEESRKQLFRQLTSQNNRNASAYIISALNERDKEIAGLGNKINSLQLSLRDLVHERDDLSSKLSQVLERREQLDELKVLVENVRNASVNIQSSEPSRATRTPNAGHADNEEDPDRDLFEHIVHHSMRAR